jgi:hypothetical protein
MYIMTGKSRQIGKPEHTGNQERLVLTNDNTSLDRIDKWDEPSNTHRAIWVPTITANLQEDNFPDVLEVLLEAFQSHASTAADRAEDMHSLQQIKQGIYLGLIESYIVHVSLLSPVRYRKDLGKLITVNEIIAASGMC